MFDVQFAARVVDTGDKCVGGKNDYGKRKSNQTKKSVKIARRSR